MCALLAASFLLHCSTCEQENSLNWFIHGSRESHSQCIKGSCKELNLTSEENTWVVLDTAGTWGEVFDKRQPLMEFSTRLIINERDEVRVETWLPLDESVTEVAITDTVGH